MRSTTWVRAWGPTCGSTTPYSIHPPLSQQRFVLLPSATILLRWWSRVVFCVSCFLCCFGEQARKKDMKTHEGRITMHYRTLGRTGLRVSDVGFGAMTIGGEIFGATDDQESLRALHRALDLGMNFIDTADAYGRGHSEELL